MPVEFALIGFLLVISVLFVVAVARAKSKVDDLQRLALESKARVEEAQQRVIEAKEKALAAKADLERLRANSSSYGINPKQVMQTLKAVAAISSSFGDIESDDKFRLAISQLKQTLTAWSAPPDLLNTSNEEDLRTEMRVFHSIIETVSQPDASVKLNEQLHELQIHGKLHLSLEGRNEAKKLIDALKCEASKADDAQYDELVRILDEFLVKPYQ